MQSGPPRFQEPNRAERDRSMSDDATDARRRPTTGRIEVAVLEADSLLREGLQALLDSTEEMACVGAWGGADDALSAMKNVSPDVLLLDLKLPNRSGLDVLETISATMPQIRVIVMIDCPPERCVMTYRRPHETCGLPLSESASLKASPDDCLQAALKMGAYGALRKSCSFQMVAQAIRSVYSGRRWIEPVTSSRLAEQYLLALRTPAHPSELAEPQHLTPRERQVVSLIARGYSNKEIAHEMELGYSTIKNYVSSILEKLNLDSRTQIAVYATGQTE